MSKHCYGLKRSPRDARDYQLSRLLDPNSGVTLPTMVDLRPKCPPVYDQGQLGSCTSNAGVANMAMLWGDANLLLSRLFLYYQERVLDGDVDQDAGANMRDIGQVLNTIGCCLDTFFPYDPSKFSESPNKDAVANATNYRIQSYHSVPDLDGIKQVLALQQNPVLMGMDVYAGLESDSTAQTGIVPMPDSNEQSIGGHAVLVVGYIDSTLGRTLLQRQRNVLIVRNSWGESWGDKGYFYLPYDYVSKYAYDCWVLVK